MSRILLVQWKAEEHAVDILRSTGHAVQRYSRDDIDELKEMTQRADAVVIDLNRQPSHGRELAGWIRRRKSTRHLPIVFIQGRATATQSARRLIPDAVYATWDEIGAAIHHALAAQPAEPVVPGAMDGYSGTPLPKKLGIRPGSRVILVDAPEGFESKLGDPPTDARYTRGARGTASIVLLFVPSQRKLHGRFEIAAKTLGEGGRLWIIWPKKASGVKTDVTENIVRAHGLDQGFVDYKIAAIDATWSGLCFARRQNSSLRNLNP